jgi:hypothetical protein
MIYLEFLLVGSGMDLHTLRLASTGRRIHSVQGLLIRDEFGDQATSINDSI